MTILSCQKRHHEPHQLPHEGWLAWHCDGRAVWPYARPKPPSVSSDEYEDHQREYGTVQIRYPGRHFIFRWHDGNQWRWQARYTHTEAIEYAQNLVNERKKSVAD